MTTAPSEGTPIGRAMVAQLRSVHAPLRHDVVVLRESLKRLDAATTRTQDVEVLLDGLTVASLAWQLQAGCVYFCSYLDAHHTLEDARMLPFMQQTFPELADPIKRLHREHEEVKHLIVAIKESARQLKPEDESSVRRVLQQITELSEHLHAHLDFEEETLFPYFLLMDRDWH